MGGFFSDPRLPAQRRPSFGGDDASLRQRREEERHALLRRRGGAAAIAATSVAPSSSNTGAGTGPIGQLPPKQHSPLFDLFRNNLKKREGGFVNDPTDPGGPTLKGISQQFLDEYRKENPKLSLPSRSRNLTDQQIDFIFRDAFFDKPHIDKLANVAGLKDSSVRLAEQIFDAGVLHDPTDAGRWLQASLQKHLGIDLRERFDNGKHDFDGIVGPKTRAAVAQAVDAGIISIISDEVVDQRTAYMRALSNFTGNSGGWLKRAGSFRFKGAGF